MKKSELIALGLMTGGGILGSIAQETAKASIGFDDAVVSAVATAGTMYAASKMDGNVKHLLLGASAVMAMNTVSEGATLLAQKTANPTVDKLVEILPRVKAPNVLANPKIETPNFSQEEEFDEDFNEFGDDGVNGFEAVNIMDQVI